MTDRFHTAKNMIEIAFTLLDGLEIPLDPYNPILDELKLWQKYQNTEPKDKALRAAFIEGYFCGKRELGYEGDD